jgi:hypothetical protein
MCHRQDRLLREYWKSLPSRRTDGQNGAGRGPGARCYIEAMEDTPRQVAAGFPEMWTPVYRKYKLFFDCAAKLAPITTEMIRTPVEGPLLQIIGRMAAAANTHGALLTLVLNGYGHDAMKLARSLFEIEINILRLKAHPEEIEDFMGYHFIRQKQLYDMFSDDQKERVPQERFDRMMSDYNSVLGLFTRGRDKTRPRNEWCSESLYKRAKEAGPQYFDLYRMFYGQASSMHHLDFAGIAAHSDADMLADMAPSWACLDDALVATGCALRSISHYDEIANLGFKERIESGPSADYVAAVKSLRPPASDGCRGFRDFGVFDPVESL